jgi:hypothetical protein
MASTSQKRLRDEELECLLLSSSEQSSDTESECETVDDVDRALLDSALNDVSDEEESATQAFVWESMDNYKDYKGQREHFTGSVGPQGGALNAVEIVDIFELFFDRQIVDNIVVETNKYAEEFLRGRDLPVNSPARAWKPVTEGEGYLLLGLFMLMGIIQKPTLRSYFSTR